MRSRTPLRNTQPITVIRALPTVRVPGAAATCPVDSGEMP
jgi:hypothetical protein